jgi:hypothetical protein
VTAVTRPSRPPVLGLGVSVRFTTDCYIRSRGVVNLCLCVSLGTAVKYSPGFDLFLKMFLCVNQISVSRNILNEA